jgi:hypothetical protein
MTPTAKSSAASLAARLATVDRQFLIHVYAASFVFWKLDANSQGRAERTSRIVIARHACG